MHGFTPGANVDITARLVADGLSKRLGQPVVVESRLGAGGTVSAAAVARAAPDGNTLTILPSGHPVAAALYKQLSYNVVDDFTFISMLTENPFILVTYPDHPAKTVADVIKAAQADPGKLTYATPATAPACISHPSCSSPWPRRRSSTSRIAARRRRSPTCSPSGRLPGRHAAGAAAVPRRRTAAADRHHRNEAVLRAARPCRPSSPAACPAIR